MKEFWVLIDNLEESASELGDSLRRANVIVSQNLSKREIEKLTGAKVTVASPARDSDIRLVQDSGSLSLDLDETHKPTALVIEVASARDEEKVVNAFDQGTSYVIARCANWKVIPLENMISKTRLKGKLLMEVGDHHEAQLALENLELGSDGVVLSSSSPEEVLKTAEVVRNRIAELDLVEVEVIGKREVGLGARACVDTIDLMMPGEGLLVGCQSNALFLVQAEVEENPYIASRPFRVNAGPVSLYVLSAVDKTNYLSELEAGHPVLIVNQKGKTRPSCVGRVKIERRPLLLVEARWRGQKIKTILQNAETIRLVTREGSRSVADLEPGSKVLVRVEQGGRHFGTLVAEESIVEK